MCLSWDFVCFSYFWWGLTNNNPSRIISGNTRVTYDSCRDSWFMPVGCRCSSRTPGPSHGVALWSQPLRSTVKTPLPGAPAFSPCWLLLLYLGPRCVVASVHASWHIIVTFLFPIFHECILFLSLSNYNFVSKNFLGLFFTLFKVY